MKIKTRQELIRAYVDFFKSKQHREIPSASLIPENDPTVLFTTAGMQPLKQYFLGERHPLGNRLVNVQKCVRTDDIDEVGDEFHHTFFEMLGNWSLGDAEVHGTSDTSKSKNGRHELGGYFKEEAIAFTFDFYTKVLGLSKEKLAATCFGGDKRVKSIPIDYDSSLVWKKLGIPEERIVFLEGGAFESKKNWWGPAGKTGPCGPDTELFYWNSEEKVPKHFDPNDARWIEIGNNVFIQYEKVAEGEYVPLKNKSVDFGGGCERALAILNGTSDNYATPAFASIIREIEKISGKEYSKHKKEFRIVADHLRAAVFIVGDERGVKPGNVGQGYVLRRLIRRAVRFGRVLGIREDFCARIAHAIVENYSDYSELQQNMATILSEIEQEEQKFRKTLEKGLRKFEEIVSLLKAQAPHQPSAHHPPTRISGEDTFLLFQSYGFPIEMTQELAGEKGSEVDVEGFEEAMKNHQNLSRTASAGVFKSGLADDSERTTRLHTATHLLNEALRVVLKDDVRQKGSNITSERLRFDFNFSRKLTDDELKEVEWLINEKIREGLQVTREEMTLEEAFDSGAQGEFGVKYPDVVSVYTVHDKKEKRGWFSREICTGPHVKNTSEIGKFKILKEESVSAGVRRIKATVD